MLVKILLDEDLSPRVAEALQRDGIDATCVRDRGRLQSSDAAVLDLAYAEDRVLVTGNVADFIKLARAREVHAGIVLIEDGALSRNQQIEVVRRVVGFVTTEADMVNKVLHVRKDGSMQLEEMPASMASSG